MLFTTFLLTTAVGAAAVQCALLLKRKRDVLPTRIPYTFLGVAATITGLLGLAWVMA